MYKQSTQLTLTYIERIENHLKSENYKNQIWWQDISTQGSVYKYNNEQTLGDSIETIKLAFQKIKENIELYDQGNIDQRNNINNSCLNSIVSWIESSPVGNWQSIIQYTNNLISYIGSMWIYIGSDFGKIKDYKQFSRKLEQANEFIKNTEKANELIKKLEPIGEKIPSEENLINTLNRINDREKEINWIYAIIEQERDNIEAIKNTIIEEENQSKEATKNIKWMLISTAENKLSEFFQWLADKYEKSLTGGKIIFNWNFLFILWIFIFIVNLWWILGVKMDSWIPPIMHIENPEIWFRLEGTVNSTASAIVEIIKILSNGFIRGIILLPSILFLWFVKRNIDRKESLQKTYEFRATAIQTLPGQLEQLNQHSISSDEKRDFLVEVLTKLYTEPTEDVQSKESIFEELKKTADIVEKLKWIFWG